MKAIAMRSRIAGPRRPAIRQIAASALAPAPGEGVSNASRPAFRASSIRPLHASRLPKPRDRRRPAGSESTPTDFSKLDVLAGAPAPSSSVVACLRDGFQLNSGLKIAEGAGVLLVGGEAFGWRPWSAREDGGSHLLNSRGQWEVANEAWGVLELVWPKPDLLILGLGPSMAPLSPLTRQYIHGLGIRIDVLDTRNASAQFNLLATERGVGNVAAALVPLGWTEGIGVR